MLIYQYPPLISGILIKRYQRFFADVELPSKEIVTAHCPNTGPMLGVCSPGSLVQLSKQDNPRRKLSYTWEMIQVNNTWVGINTMLPNRVIKIALEKRLWPQLIYEKITTEVPYGTDKKSRIDFLLSNQQGEQPIYIEVKNTTWSQDNLALFPDTVTTRGQKHLKELMALAPFAKVIMLYFINRSDCDSFAPGEKTDPQYAQLWRQAVTQGVTMLPCRFEVTPVGISYLGLAQLK